MLESKNKVRLIINPFAGRKRRFLFNKNSDDAVKTIKALLKKYSIKADIALTQYAGHATEIAKKSIQEGYTMVIASGGDGTITEVAQGLINSNVTLAILPQGSFMNIAKMLFIPFSVEEAVRIIKEGHTKKIDVGSIQEFNGKTLDQPYYFLENAGVSLEAEMHYAFLKFEKGNLLALFEMIRIFLDFYNHRVEVILDNKETIKTKASYITINNGPYSNAAFHIAPEARLTDHYLTISLFTMSKFNLVVHLLKMIIKNSQKSPEIIVRKAKTIRVITKFKRRVHADGLIFSKTPITCQIISQALKVIVPKKINVL